MSFPFLFESNFEEGTVTGSGWDFESDTEKQLDIVNCKVLKRSAYQTAIPFMGAYCMRITSKSGISSAYISESDINIAAGETRWFRFKIWFSPDFSASVDNNNIEILEGRSGSTTEFVFGFRIIAATNQIELGVGGGSISDYISFDIDRGIYYCIELKATVDSGAGNDGSINLYVTKDGRLAANESFPVASADNLDQGSVDNARLGLINHLATTTGTILIDQFVFDDARIYPITDRFKETIVLSKSGHAFVGRGQIEHIQLISGNGTDCILSVYDTDDADTTETIKQLKNTKANEVVESDISISLMRGAYIELSGTNPSAIIKIKNVVAYGSPSAVRGSQ